MLRVFLVHMRVGALHELQYRVNFWIQLLQSLVSILSSLGALAVLFRHTEALAGWQPMELVALLGIYFFMNGFIQTFVQPGMDRFLADIRRGTFDFVLTKPRDAQLLVAVRRISLWSLLDAALGVALLVVAWTRLARPFGAGQVLALAVVLAAGMVIVGSFWFILATLAFWFVKIENILFVFQSTYQAGRWPIRIYPRALRLVLTFLVPVAFAVTVPAEAAVGRLGAGTMLLAVALAVGIAGVARVFWHIGVRHYAGASA
jgi:ABC-2 type transport system permease protein